MNYKMVNGYKAKKRTISEKEYQELKKYKKIDTELLENISRGIKDIITGRIKEV